MGSITPVSNRLNRLSASAMRGVDVTVSHHRVAAALKAGLSEVPCWVRDLDDDAAYMALVTSNSQGELSPLEIGLHAFRLGKGSKWTGPTGKDYSAKIGLSAGAVSQYKTAAEVIDTIKFTQVNLILDKTKHLYEIHSLPAPCWPAAVQIMLEKAWSAKETNTSLDSNVELDALAKLPETEHTVLIDRAAAGDGLCWRVIGR